MKNLNILIVVINLFLLIGCQFKADESFLPYQTFNEFHMTEVITDRVLEPYLLIHRTTDTIKIVRIDKEKDTMVYLNKGKYWYSSVRINYNYTLLGKLKILLRTPTWDSDYMQIDVYRYIFENLIIEAFFHSDGQCDFQEMGLMPDYITVSNLNSSRSYTFFNNLGKILDPESFDNTIIWKVYQSHLHSILNEDTLCFSHTLYDYDALENTIYLKRINSEGNIFSADTIKLNSLGIYHIPIYQFSIDDAKYQLGINGNEMRIRISCTTLETDTLAYDLNTDDLLL